MSVYEGALADGTVAAHSPERTIRHIPFPEQLLIIYTNLACAKRELITCTQGN